MKNQIKVLHILRREIFKGISFFEFFLFVFTIVIGVGLFIWQIIEYINNGSIKTLTIISYSITLLDIPIGILAAAWLSKRSRWAPAILALDALMYGITNLIAGNFLLAFVNSIIVPFLWLFAFFCLWSKQIKNKEIITKKLNIFSGLLISGLLFIGATIFGIISLFFIHKNSSYDVFSQIQIWFDSFAAILMLMAVIMGILRFRETWYLFFIANLLKIILFSISIYIGNMNSLMLLVLSLAFFINSIFGMLVWKDSKKITIGN
ncbi:MAG: nicotinamide mononucleotide transporter [Mycoplasmataceae bacterium]|nr:nicotinamide mononucleotide transporter [Mycoplasmataceae bacterium]